MKNIYIITACWVLLVHVLFEGCASSKQVVKEPLTSPEYDPDEVAKRAAQLGLRPVDYLHKMNTLRLQASPE